jgi:hypothetical protein
MFVREIAASGRLAVADLNAPVVALLKAANAASPLPAQGLIPDRVHPSAGVLLVMTEALLRAWHAPSVVSSVEIDGAAGTVVDGENTTVSLVGRKEGLSWTQLDKSLPMFVESEQESISLALCHSDFTDALNWETLKVTGLIAGNYRLQIDDELIGVFGPSQLANGLNVGILNTQCHVKQRPFSTLLTGTITYITHG